jgi:hypothetical protein
MAIRTDLPRVPGKSPSLFNSVGTTLAVLAGAAAFTAVTLGVGVATIAGLGIGVALAAPAAALGAAAIGGLVGGVIGKSKMKYEAAAGRPVKNPGFLNSGLMNGLMLGGLGALAVVAAPLIIPSAVATGGILAAGGALEFLTGTAAVAAIIGVPAVLGSLWTRSSQSHEVAAVSREVEIARASAQAERARSQGLAQYQGAGVSRADMEALETRQAQGRSGTSSFIDQLQASRAAAGTQLSK